MTESPLLYATNTALGRFGIANLVDSPDPFVSSMPCADLVNPVTGTPTLDLSQFWSITPRVLSTTIAAPTTSGPCRASCHWN
ncbi:MAG TPA: hypothetical protein VJR50_17380 [Mycobacterium sp.]|nr:hypothetical protein [Mycobacterium sp.]